MSAFSLCLVGWTAPFPSLEILDRLPRELDQVLRLLLRPPAPHLLAELAPVHLVVLVRLLHLLAVAVLGKKVARVFGRRKEGKLNVDFELT